MREIKILFKLAWSPKPFVNWSEKSDPNPTLMIFANSVQDRQLQDIRLFIIQILINLFDAGNKWRNAFLIKNLLAEIHPNSVIVTSQGDTELARKEKTSVICDELIPLILKNVSYCKNEEILNQKQQNVNKLKAELSIYLAIIDGGDNFKYVLFDQKSLDKLDQDLYLILIGCLEDVIQELEFMKSDTRYISEFPDLLLYDPEFVEYAVYWIYIKMEERKRSNSQNPNYVQETSIQNDKQKLIIEIIKNLEPLLGRPPCILSSNLSIFNLNKYYLSLQKQSIQTKNLSNENFTDQAEKIQSINAPPGYSPIKNPVLTTIYPPETVRLSKQVIFFYKMSLHKIGPPQNEPPQNEAPSYDS